MSQIGLQTDSRGSDHCPEQRRKCGIFPIGKKENKEELDIVQKQVRMAWATKFRPRSGGGNSCPLPLLP
jgi:hypothetical protein